MVIKLSNLSEKKLMALSLIFFIIILFFISSCTNQPKEDIEFKKKCQEAGYEWMLMNPTQDGKFIKAAKECWGCMVGNIEHICDKEKFYDFIPPK
ncbi:hypothetical protein HYX02_06175 [Candidatus Woesearchaeota archaeon]|nr:hypothetical protein [Candidatus Woesearchaeota archaeon]